MELASLHFSGTYKLEVPPKSLKDLCNLHPPFSLPRLIYWKMTLRWIWPKCRNFFVEETVSVTRYGLDVPKIDSRWGARFSAPVQTGRGAHPVSCTVVTRSFSWG